MSVFIVRAFVELREALAIHNELAKRIDEEGGRPESQYPCWFPAGSCPLDGYIQPRLHPYLTQNASIYFALQLKTSGYILQLTV